MSKFIIRRLLLGIGIIFFGCLITYAVIRCLPTSYVEGIARQRAAAASAGIGKSYKEWLAELNALSGPAVSLVVFSSGYRPRRGDRVVYDGQQWTVTRHERFNGKPMIFIE